LYEVDSALGRWADGVYGLSAAASLFFPDRLASSYRIQDQIVESPPPHYHGAKDRA
jgi:hypothetical protein